MTISPGLYIGLAVSVGLGIIIMIATLLTMYKKTKKIKKEYANQENKNDVKPRDNYGELLWELKNKTKNPLDDSQMEYLINTAWRNDYKTFNLINFQSDYEKNSFIKLIKLKNTNLNPDITVINGDTEFNDIFDVEYKKATSNKMIVIANASRKNNEVKKLISYLKTIKVRYEWQNYGKGIILVVK